MRILNVEKDAKLPKIDIKFLFLMKLIEKADKKTEEDLALAKFIKNDIE